MLDPFDGYRTATEDDWDDLGELMEELPAEELEEIEEQFVDEATAARTIGELEVEIGILDELVRLAEQVRRSGGDRKWESWSRRSKITSWTGGLL